MNLLTNLFSRPKDFPPIPLNTLHNSVIIPDGISHNRKAIKKFLELHGFKEVETYSLKLILLKDLMELKSQENLELALIAFDDSLLHVYSLSGLESLRYSSFLERLRLNPSEHIRIFCKYKNLGQNDINYGKPTDISIEQ